MARLTLKVVNKALADIGCKEELVQGDGYFYFTGGDAEKWHATMVYAYRLNHLTLDQWLDSWRSLHEDYVKSQA